MASGSFKDTSKTLHNCFSNPGTLNTLPDEVLVAVEAYITKHPNNNDEHDSQRMHEELVTIYNKYVVKNSKNFEVFLQLLTLLQSTITGQNRLTEWWNLVIRPVVDGLGHKRSAVAYAEIFLLGVLDYNSEEDKDGELAKVSSHFTKILLGAYLKRTKTAPVEGETLTLEDTYVSRQLESVFIEFGRRKPKDLMTAIDHLVVDKDYRVQALGLLSAFVRQQPPHLYLASQTPIIEHLLKCLMIDTSTTVLSLALTNLIMFLPHIPTPVITHLPRLFLIYSRLLCWERFSPSSTDLEKQIVTEDVSNSEKSAEAKPVDEDPDWETLHHSFDTADSTPPELFYYFTFLYGLYPLNFMSYIRRPRKYLKNIDFPRAQDFDLDRNIIQSRTEEFRRWHMLHPNFYTTTIEDELTENKWLKSDAADVVEECMGLLNTAALKEPGQTSQSTPLKPTKNRDSVFGGPLTQEPDLERSTSDHDFADDIKSTDSQDESWLKPLLSESNEQPQQTQGSTRKIIQRSEPTRNSRLGSPNPSLHDRQARQISPFPSEEMSSKRDSSVPSIRSTDDTVHSKPPSRTQMSRVPAVRTVPREQANMAFLQREVVLLRNDLNFERYLKNQHLSYIGQMQRRRIKEATIEAETQNMIISNRVLHAKLGKKHAAFEKLQDQTNDRANHWKRTESDLSSKVRTLREGEKKLRAECTTLREDLGRAAKDSDQLRSLVVEIEARELLSQRQVASMTLDIENLESLKQQIADLQSKLKTYQDRELCFEQAKSDQERLKTELATTTLKLRSKDSSVDRLTSHFDGRIAELETKLRDAQNPVSDQPGRLAPAFERLLERAVADEKHKTAKLECQNEKLQRHIAQLEMRFRELDADAGSPAKPVGVQSSSWPTRTAARTRYDSTDDDGPEDGDEGSASGLTLKVDGRAGIRRGGSQRDRR